MELKDIIAMFTSKEELQFLSATQMQAVLDTAYLEVLKDGRILATFMSHTIAISHEMTWDGHEVGYWVARKVIK